MHRDATSKVGIIDEVEDRTARNMVPAVGRVTMCN